MAVIYLLGGTAVLAGIATMAKLYFRQAEELREEIARNRELRLKLKETNERLISSRKVVDEYHSLFTDYSVIEEPNSDEIKFGGF